MFRQAKYTAMLLNASCQVAPRHLKTVKRYEWMEGLNEYNNFFHPYLCHVCKKVYQTDFIRCDQCKMIVYCNESHKSRHRAEHQELCDFLLQYLVSMNSGWREMNVSMSKWLRFRLQILNDIETKYRSLLLYETQMIIFAPSCLSCHKQEDLKVCNACFSVSYCSAHKLQVKYEHPCKLLRTSLNLEIINLHFINFRLLTNFPRRDRPFDDTISYIKQHTSYMQNRSEKDSTSFEHVYSDYVSGPLTLYDGLKKARLLNVITSRNCVLHIISATALEKKHELTWEILLHLVRNIKRLIVVLIGTELQTNISKMKLCKYCIESGKELEIQCFCMKYGDYTFNKSFLSPNVIIVFQAHLNTFIGWRREHNLKKPQEMMCPYFLTAGSQKAAIDVIRYIEFVIPGVKYIYNASNSFKSFMICQLLSDDLVGIRNLYVIIYANIEKISLKVFKKPVQKKNSHEESSQEKPRLNPLPMNRHLPEEPQPSTSWQ